MQKIGVAKSHGFNLDDLQKIQLKMSNIEVETELVDLNQTLKNLKNIPNLPDAKEAYVLIIKKLFDSKEFIGYSADRGFNELKSFVWDTFLVSTRNTEIQKKHPRANICIKF